VRLLSFLQRELAPVPGRLRAALRITVSALTAVLVTVTVGGDSFPHAHWTIVTIFTVSQADAGASLRKSFQRVIGTLIGGGLGILVVIAFVDLPVFYVSLLGAVVAFGIFCSFTTSAPYVMLLGSLTFVLVTFVPPGSGASEAVETGLWRILAIAIGVMCGTGAQLFLWPDDPEAKLREALAGRLASITRVMRALAILEGGDSTALSQVTAPSLAGDDLSTQLDLLANAEARHPSLRRRHTEQLALIVEVDRLVTTAVWLINDARDWATAPNEEIQRQLLAIALECSRLADALRAGQPPTDPPPPGFESGHHEAGEAPGLGPTLDDMRLALHRTREALGFLDPDRPELAPGLDHPVRTPLLTPAFSLKNTEAVTLALKAGVGLELSYLLMHALSWGALVTAGVSAVLVSQTSLGAIVQKSVLRIGGALLGGALGIATIVVAMPNLQNLGSLLIVAGLGFLVAAWIAVGSSRISYLGLQTGMAFAMCVTDPRGPTTDLTIGRDRVLGILVGVLAMLLVNGTLWPARARLTMWSRLPRAFRALAGLARLAPETREYPAQLQSAVRFRSSVYTELAATLRLSAESTLEPDADLAEAEREWVSRLTVQTQAVFLALLALIRHRVAPAFPILPAPVQEAMRALDDEVAKTLEALANRLERRPADALPDLTRCLAELEALIPQEEQTPAARNGAIAVQVAERDHAGIARGLVREVAALQESIDASLMVRAQ
jgi:multidrug resistance protein MdtO